jgi:hypothetical protein
MLKDFLVLGAGTAAILFGIFNKQFYYAPSLEKPAPTWFGRGIFFLVGVGFIAVAVRDLLLR